ncbi:hypothetical protein [Acinetobacter baumannii]|uniref:Uncharacterized protein n=1 Tax=Acinetobacter baumannii TaxID=470 RepID=A0AA44XS40_ACIBA|nr:hypothetical protein [Acinetobacter baumannii]EKA64615.1 hypothetical protein ACINWC692_2885 [Acinetobacter baumannii WC-692]MDV7369205.1 hypothetical protein [Acinetobacter baumannii]PQL82145.1 hypothetical protein CV954_013910 [Acinetobacter baumannii]
MNIKISTYLTISLGIILSACGDNDSDIESPAPQNCISTYDQWVQLKKDDSLSDTNTKLNCNGIKRSEQVSNEGYNYTVYEWNTASKPRGIQIGYGNGKLVARTFLPDEKKSSCFPSSQIIDSLKLGQTLEQTQNTIGCSGQWVKSYSIYGGAIDNTYIWESTDSKEVLSLIFNNNLLKTKEYKKPKSVSSCIPTRSQWNNVIVSSLFGDTYQSATSKLGCNDVDKQWGKSDRSTDIIRIEVGPFSGLIISKFFIPKLGDNNSCAPSFENWNNVTFGSTYNQAKSFMGCEGVLTGITVPEVGTSDEEIETLFYQWSNFNTSTTPPIGIEHSLIFKGGQLISKSFSNNNSPFSSCNPSRQGFEKIKIGDKFEDIKDVYGCSGTWVKASSTGSNYGTATYAWGDIESTTTMRNYAYIELNNDNNVTSKYIYFAQ